MKAPADLYQPYYVNETLYALINDGNFGFATQMRAFDYDLWGFKKGGVWSALKIYTDKINDPYDACTLATVDLTVWHTVELNFNTTNVTAYIDGIRAGACKHTPNSGSPSNLWMHGWGVGSAQGLKLDNTVWCDDMSGVEGTCYSTQFPTVITTVNSIDLISPANNTFNNSQTNNFCFNATTNTNFSGCYLWTNKTGNWEVNTSNTSTILNHTNYCINWNSNVDGSYLWNIQCNDTSGGGYGFNTTNYTINIGIPPNVTLISPANNTWSNSLTINFTFNATTNDNFKNCSVWTNSTGWNLNNSNLTTVLNNTNYGINITFGLDSNYLWNIQCFDLFNNSNFSNSNYTIRIDSIKPSFFGNSTNDTNIYIGKYINMSVNVTDTNPSYYKFSFNQTGSFVNETNFYPYSNNLNISFIKQITTTGYFCYQVWANDSANNINVSDKYCFISYNGIPQVNNIVWLASGGYTTGSRIYGQTIINITSTCQELIDNDLIGCNVTVTNPDGVIVINNQPMSNTSTKFNYSTPFSLTSVGNWIINVTAYDTYDVNSSITNITVLANTITIYDGIYAYDFNTLVDTAQTLLKLNLTTYGYDTIGQKINMSTFNNTYLSLLNYINYTKTNNSVKTFIKIYFDAGNYSNLSTYTNLTCNIINQNLTLLKNPPFDEAVQFIIMNLNTTQIESDTTTFVNTMSKCIVNATGNKFKVYSDYRNTSLSAYYVTYFNLTSITATTIDTYINLEKNYLRNTSSITRIYSGFDETLKANASNFHSKILTKLRGIPTGIGINSTIANISNGDVVIFNNESTDTNKLYYINSSTQVGKDVWDSTNKNFIEQNTDGWVYINLSAYTFALIYYDNIDYLTLTSVFASTSTANLIYGQNQTGSGESAYSIVGANDAMFYGYDPSYGHYNQFMIHYEWLNSSYITNYTQYCSDGVVIIADYNSLNINNTINCSNKIFGYISVADYVDTDIWSNNKKAEIDVWLDNMGVNVFLDGLDSGATGINFATRFLDLVYHVQIEKNKTCIANDYTSYSVVGVGSACNYDMKESFCARWDGVVANPTYSWEDFSTDLIRAQWAQTNKNPQLGITFGAKDDYDKLQYCYAEFLVLYGTTNGNLYKYSQPNFQNQQDIYTFNPGVQLESSWTKINDSYYYRKFSNGIVWFNPTDHSWNIENNKVVNNLTFKLKAQIYAAVPAASTPINISINGNMNALQITYDNIGVAQWDAKTVEKSFTQYYNKSGRYVFRFYSALATNPTGLNIYNTNDNRTGVFSFYENSVNNPPAIDGTWTAYGRSGANLDYATTNFEVNIELNQTVSAELDNGITNIIQTNITYLLNNKVYTNLTISSIKPYNITIHGDPIIVNKFINISYYNTTDYINLSYLNTTSCNTSQPSFKSTVINSENHDVCISNNNAKTVVRVSIPSLSGKVYQILEGIFSVIVSSPVNNTINNSHINNYCFNTAMPEDGTFEGCGLWTNYTGVWKVNTTNSTTIINGINYCINWDSKRDNTVIWNIGCNITTGTNFYGEYNNTIRLDTTPPTINFIYPTQNQIFEGTYTGALNLSVNEGVNSCSINIPISEIIYSVNQTCPPPANFTGSVCARFYDSDWETHADPAYGYAVTILEDFYIPKNYTNANYIIKAALYSGEPLNVSFFNSTSGLNQSLFNITGLVNPPVNFSIPLNLHDLINYNSTYYLFRVINYAHSAGSFLSELYESQVVVHNNPFIYFSNTTLQYNFMSITPLNGNYIVNMSCTDFAGNSNSSLLNFSVYPYPIINSISILPSFPQSDDVLNCSFNTTYFATFNHTAKVTWFNSSDNISFINVNNYDYTFSDLINNSIYTTGIGTGSVTSLQNYTYWKCQVNVTDNFANSSNIVIYPPIGNLTVFSPMIPIGGSNQSNFIVNISVTDNTNLANCTLSINNSWTYNLTGLINNMPTYFLTISPYPIYIFYNSTNQTSGPGCGVCTNFYDSDWTTYGTAGLGADTFILEDFYIPKIYTNVNYTIKTSISNGGMINISFYNNTLNLNSSIFNFTGPLNPPINFSIILTLSDLINFNTTHYLFRVKNYLLSSGSQTEAYESIVVVNTTVNYIYPQLSNGNYQWNLTCISPSGDTVSTPNYVYIVSTTQPSIFNFTTDSSSTYPTPGETLHINFTSNPYYATDTCNLWTNDTGIWHISNTTFINSSITNIGFNFTVQNYSHGNVSTIGYYVWCNDTFGNGNVSINYTFKVHDIVNPTITFGPGNNFNTLNTSVITGYLENLTINVTFADFNLFQAFINVSCDINKTAFYWEMLDINVTTINKYVMLNMSTFPLQQCRINIGSSDDHTKTKIDDYKVDKINNGLKYTTTEGNNIEVTSNMATTNVKSNKNVDRYNFEFDYSTKQLETSYTVKSDKQIYYRENSQYPGHFVIWNEDSKQGNWIDFDAGDKEYTVEQVNENEYTVTVASKIITEDLPGKKNGLLGILGRDMTQDEKVLDTYGYNNIQFNTIGGTNIVNVTYIYYVGAAINVSNINLYDNTTFNNFNVTIHSILSSVMINETVNISGNNGYLTNISNGTYSFTFSSFSNGGYFNQTYIILVNETLQQQLYATYEAIVNIYVYDLATTIVLSNINITLNNTNTGQINFNNSGITVTTFYINHSVTDYRVDLQKIGYQNLTTSFSINNSQNITLNLNMPFFATFNLIDERTLEAFNISSPTRINFLLMCSSGTYTSIINSSFTPVTINCSYQKFKFILDYGTTSYYRTLMISPTHLANATVYLIDLATTQSVFDTFIIDDLYRTCTNAEIFVKKTIGNNTVDITGDTVDIENKVGAYLIFSHQYIIEVDCNGLVKVIGPYSADTAGTKTIRLYDISAGSPATSFDNSVTKYSSIVNDSYGDYYAYTYFKDSSNLTTSATWYVYAGTYNGTLLYTVTTTGNFSDGVEFFYNVTPYINSTSLFSSLHIVYTGGSDHWYDWILSTIDATTVIVGRSGAFIKDMVTDFFGGSSSTSSSFLNWTVIIILGMMALMSTIRTANIMALVVTGLGAIFALFNLFTISGVILAIAILIALASLLKAEDRGQEG